MTDLNWREVKYNPQEESLLLSGLRLTSIPEAVVNLFHGQKVSHLDLSYNDLKSVEGLSLFRHLDSLVLDNNKLSMIGGGMDEFSRPVRFINSKLRVLSVNNNRITNIDSFLRNISICFPNLTYLSLLRNPCCPDDLSSSSWTMLQPWLGREGHAREFREKCLKALPKLQFLNSTNLLRDSRVKRSGRGMRVGLKSFEQQLMDGFVKFKNGLIEVFTDEDEGEFVGGSPLPVNQRNPGDHHGTYVRSRMHYIGKQSEGNRFIGNGQL